MSKLTVGYTDEWFFKEGIERIPTMKEDGSRVDNLPGRFEWWYFDAHMDDGSVVIAIIFSKPYTNIQVPCSPQVKLSITSPEGKTLLNVDNFTEKDFKAKTDRCDVQVGKNWIKGDLVNYKLHFEVQGNIADLEFSRVVPSWRPGTGKCYFDEKYEKYFGWIVPIPYGKVGGNLHYNGIDHQVKGTGYHDHNFGNTPIREIIDHWYWGRLTVDDYNCIFFQLISTKKFGSEALPLFMFAKGSEIMTGDGSKLTIIGKDVIKHESRKNYPGKMDFIWNDNDKMIQINLSNPQVLEARSLLAGFPFLKRKIARLIVNPYYFRWNADVEFIINFGKIKDHKKQKAIYESMMLS